MIPITTAKEGAFAGHPLLRCINHDSDVLPHGPELKPGESTAMRLEEGWFALTSVLPQRKNRLGFFDSSKGRAVRFYACSLCGYVELYHGPTVAPEVWEADASPNNRGE